MNNRPDRTLLRAALQIDESLRRSQDCPDVAQLPEAAWAHALDGQRRFQIASSRGWSGAARRMAQRLHTTLICLQTELDLQLRKLADQPTRPAVPTAAEIVRDLAALGDEFDEVTFDLRRRVVSVQTDTIILEGINLGPFEIRLSLVWTGVPLQ